MSMVKLGMLTPDIFTNPAYILDCRSDLLSIQNHRAAL